uniref:Tudor domain-containing protein 5 n=1 Tax=Tetraodon nigroviridis TaxID=99883 RepID=H3BWI0_TETNG
MNQEKILPKLKKDIRSLLISSKLGVEPEQLRRDYVALVGEPLPLRPLGLTNVMDMVVAMPDVVSVHFREDGSVYLKAVGVESTQNIEMLVAKQRTSKADVQRLKRGHLHGGCHRPPRVLLPRRGLAPPAVPAQLRAQLWKLLSQGPVRLSNLEASFLRCFGHPLCVQNFGFYSTQEMLRTAADLVVIHQDKLGSVVSLRMMPRPPFMKIGPWNFLPGGSRDTKWTRPDPGRAVPPAVSLGAIEAQLFLSYFLVNLLEVPAGPLSSSETVAPVPARAQPETHATTHAEGQRFEKHVQKLEKEFYHQIVENGVAGTISQELKEKLRKVVSQAGGRLCVHDLPAEYKRLYGEDLLLLPSGFVSVTELLDAMSDTFHLEAAESGAGAAWMVLQTRRRPRVQKCSSLPPVTTSGTMCRNQVSQRSTCSVCPAARRRRLSNSAACLNPQVCRTSAVPPDALQGQRLKKPSRLGEGEVQVLVEHVESPGCFYVSVCDSREARATEDMMIQMRRCYRCPEVSERYRLPERFVRRGQVCCLCPEGVWFYRVVIHRILSPTHVEVYFVDFGNTIAAPRNRLKFLKSCYSDLPAQAIPSALPGIKPAQGGWTPEATACFRKLCCAHPLVGASAGYTGDVLLLYLCDARTGNQIDFHRLLLREG